MSMSMSLQRGVWVVLVAMAVAAMAQNELVKISVVAHEMPAAELLAELAKQGQLELEAHDVPDRKVTLRLNQIQLDAALRLVCLPLGLEYDLRGTKLVVRGRRPDEPEIAPLPGLPPALNRSAAALLRAVRKDPTDGAAVRALGDWLAEQRPDWRELLPTLLAGGWSIDNPTPEDQLLGARVLAGIGCYDAAATLAYEARKTESLSVAARLLLARIDLRRGDPNRAYLEARRTLTAVPDNPEAAALVAEGLLLSQEREDEALAEAMTAHARWPESPTVLSVLGNLLRRQKQTEGQGAAYLARALELAPHNPDARYGLAVLDAGETPGTRREWLSFLDLEPHSDRAARVRLRLASTAEQTLTERGGRVWAVTPNGERVLYADRFRKQLQITDSRGFGLALQVTDQEDEKFWAALSPDEQWMAWVVEGSESTIFLQNLQASGGHKAIAKSVAAGDELRRLAWSPDGKLLLFTQVSRDGAVKLRCWNHETEQEVAPPAFLQAVPGLGDVVWLDEHRCVGTVTRDGRQVAVEVHEAGQIDLLRPAAEPWSYQAPALDPAGGRVLYQSERLRDVYGAPSDGSWGGSVPLLSGAQGRDARCALWIPGRDSVAISLRDRTPVVVDLAGLPVNHLVRLQCDPLFARGPQPPTYTFSVVGATAHSLRGELRTTLVGDDGRDGWSQASPVTASAKPVAVEVRPEVTRPGVYWLRADLTLNDVADPPRWYQFELTQP